MMKKMWRNSSINNGKDTSMPIIQGNEESGEWFRLLGICSSINNNAQILF